MDASTVDKAAENARNLQLRAAEIQSKAHKAEVASILSRHPHAAGDVKFLHNQGLYSDGPVVAVPKSKLAAGLESREAKKKAARQEASMAEKANSERIPTKYWTVGSFSARLIGTRCLQTMDPMVFSTANLAAVKRSWSRDAVHPELLRLLEFPTGIPSTFRLTEKMRNWEKFEELLCKMYAEPRSRLMGKALPVDYSITGVFEYKAFSRSEFTLTLRAGANSFVSMTFEFPVMGQSTDANTVFVGW